MGNPPGPSRRVRSTTSCGSARAGSSGFSASTATASTRSSCAAWCTLSARRQGVFSCLFEAAMTEVRDRGRAPGAARGGPNLRGRAGIRPIGRGRDRALRAPHGPCGASRPRSSQTRSSPLREAQLEDAPVHHRLPRQGLRHPRRGVREGGREGGPRDAHGSASADTLVIDYAREPVGTVRVDRDDGAAGIYGFAVSRSSRAAGSAARCCRGSPGTLSREGLGASHSRCRSPTTPPCGCT